MFCSSIFLNIAQMLYKIKKQIFIFPPFELFFWLMEWLSSKGHNLVYFWKTVNWRTTSAIYMYLSSLDIFNLF